MINDEYRKIILTKMHEILKIEEFRKKGNNFVKQENNVYLIIQLQSSMSSSQKKIGLDSKSWGFLNLN